MPSLKPTGDATNDRVWFNYYRPTNVPPGQRVPCVILLHGLGITGVSSSHLAGKGVVFDYLTTPFGQYLASHGIAAIAPDLPYHMRRRSPSEKAVDHFASTDTRRVVAAFEQSLADIQAVKRWALTRAEVDPTRFGVIGISLGAIIAHRAMGEDPSLYTGAAILGIGNLPRFYGSSLLMNLLRGRRRSTRETEIQLLRRVDPLENSDAHRPRRVLMIQAARDIVFPPDLAEELWVSLGKPPIRWLDTNHMGPVLGMDGIMRGTHEFLTASWANRAPDPFAMSHIGAPTLKLGLMSGLGSPVTPAIQLQVFSIGRTRERMSLVSGNLGLNFRGLFLGVSVTASPFVDIGVGRRANNSAIYPYLSLHTVL